MAVVNNTASEIGDVIIIESNTPLQGLIGFNGYTDIVIGETGDRFFDRLFQYSVDGVFFSGWQPLTNANLQAIPIQAYQTFYINFRYIRNGTDATGLLEWISTFIDGIYEGFTCNKPITEKSIFSDIFCNNIEVQELCTNLALKLYREGIVPKYIERGDDPSNIANDEDYIAFWKAISCYFALIIVYSTRFEKVYIRDSMLIDYLRQRGLFLCGQESLGDLQYIANNLFDEMRQRGTIQIFKEKNYEYQDLHIQPVMGEFLRLICYNSFDEFIELFTPPSFVGLNINQSSPLFTGTTGYGILLNKFKNIFKEEDITLDDITNVEGEITYNVPNAVASNFIEIQSDIVGDTMQLNCPSPVPFLDVVLKVSNIDPTLNYELTFDIAQKQVKRPNIALFARVFDVNNIELIVENVQNGSITNTFANPLELNQLDRFYNARLILFKQGHSLIPSQEGALDFGVGNHLRMTNYDALTTFRTPSYVLFVIRLLYTDNLDTIRLWNIKVRPSTRNYSTGFVQSSSILQLWLKNNNNQISNEQLQEYANRYLFPMETRSKITFL